MTAPASRFKGTCFAFRMEVALAWRSWLLFLPNMSCMRRLWGKNSKTPKASALWGPTSPRKRRTRTWKASMTSLTLWHSKRSRKLCKCHSFYAACLCECRMYHVFRSYLSWSHMFNGTNERWQVKKSSARISIFPVCFGDLPFHCPWNLKTLCCNCTHISHPFSDLSCGSYTHRLVNIYGQAWMSSDLEVPTPLNGIRYASSQVLCEAEIARCPRCLWHILTFQSLKGILCNSVTLTFHHFLPLPPRHP